MTDEQLIKRLKKDDKESFNELFERYYDRCYSYAMALLKSTASVEDVIQNVFLKVWLARKNIDISRPFENYLLTSIRNEAISFLRLKANSSKSLNMPEVEDSAPDAVDDIAYAEINSHLLGIVQKMPEQRKRVFELSRMQGLKVEEIAVRLNISKRTVERHIHLALKDIKRELS